MTTCIFGHSEYPNQIHFIFGKKPSPFEQRDTTGLIWIEVIDENGVRLHPSDPLMGWYTKDEVREWILRFRRDRWFRLKKRIHILDPR